MNSVHRNTVEKLVHRELTEIEWTKLQKAEFSEVLHWVQYHAEKEKNN